MSKKEKVVYKEKINWKKEAALLPGYLIVLIWIAFTPASQIWIQAATHTTSREIYSGPELKKESAFQFDN